MELSEFCIIFANEQTMKTFSTLLFCLLIWKGFAQVSESKVFQILIKDAENLRSIPNVQLRYLCGGQGFLMKSDSLGLCFISCHDISLKLSLSSEFYKSQNELVLKHNKALELKGDTLVFTIFLEPKAAKLMRETVVTNPYKPQTIFGSERLSVADFEILDNNNLLLLTYERKLNKGAELLLVDSDEKIQFSKSLGNDALHLFTDFRGFIHLMYKNRLDFVYHTDDVFDLVAMDKQYYQRFVAPIIDTSKTKFYFTNYRSTYPAADFFVYDDLDSSYFKISRIADEIMMDMFIKEYLWVDTRTKLWARQMEQKTGIDKEDIVGEAIFTQSIFYKEIYAPMFLKNDTLYLFDFYKNYLRKFNRNGDKIDSIGIDMHINPKRTGWCNRIIQDPKTGGIYAVYDKGGYTVIRAVNLNDGTLSFPLRLDFRYVEKLIIHDNTIYYTYRPYESIQKKYLYKQMLPLFFDENSTAQDRRILSGKIQNETE